MQSSACPACQAQIPAGYESCPTCGAELAAPAVAERSQRWLWWTLGIGGGCLVMCAAIFALMTLVRGVVRSSKRNHTRENPAQSIAQSEIALIVGALRKYASANDDQFPDGLGRLMVPDENGTIYLDESQFPRNGAFEKFPRDPPRDAPRDPPRDAPRDPWGRPYHYDPPEDGATSPHVYSLGKDGAPGGADEDADVDETTARSGR